MEPTQLAALIRELDDAADERELLLRASKCAVETIAGCHSASITLNAARGRPAAAVATDELGQLGDLLQHELNEGPCFDAARHDCVSYSGDLAQDDRWPQWGPTVARRIGVRSMLCHPLASGDRHEGAITMYSHHLYAYTAEARAQAEVIAAIVGLTLAHRRQESALTAALASRTVIGEALGILRERYDMDTEHAFEYLKRVSSATETKISTIAEKLTRGEETTPPPHKTGRS